MTTLTLDLCPKASGNKLVARILVHLGLPTRRLYCAFLALLAVLPVTPVLATASFKSLLDVVDRSECKMI